ncbi:MAG: hypothetical protein AAGF95_34170 [Chloroflexota bacterium]
MHSRNPRASSYDGCRKHSLMDWLKRKELLGQDFKMLPLLAG